MSSSIVFQFRDALLDEMKLPDFKGRHLFTAWLRIIVFLAAWLMFFIFYPAIWAVAPVAPLIFNIGFLLTAICYYNVLRENYIISMMLLEVGADVMSQTTIVYMLGIHSWAPFLVYCLYVIAAGSLFGYISALISATLALICYSVLLLLIASGAINEFVYPTTHAGFLNLESFKPYFNITFLPLALVIIVYTAKIGNYFTKMKERALERRNLQLMALNNIGATIRKVMSPSQVIDQVLRAVVQGLGFEICLLALLDENKMIVRFYVPKGNSYVEALEKALGKNLSELTLPITDRGNSALMAIMKNRVIIRNDFSELTRGIQPVIASEEAVRAQKELGFRKFVVTPLVAEHKVSGALIGATLKSYVEENVIDTLDNFANQAALAIESSQLFEDLKLANSRLIEANKVKSEFLAMMSHELRTPLNAVIGYSDILSDYSLGTLNDDQTKAVREVLRNARNLLELINNILDLARLEVGRLELNLESFVLRSLIDDVCSTLQPLVQQKTQELTVHQSDDNYPEILADSMKLRQILINLLGNAIKFTESNGKIDVYVDYCEDAAQARALFLKDFSDELAGNPAFVLRVRDTGVGIKPEDLELIFEVFRQADSTFTRRHQGTGLGLALTRQLVLLHHGLISVHSEVGKGAEFRVLIPQKKEQRKDTEV